MRERPVGLACLLLHSFMTQAVFSQTIGTAPKDVPAPYLSTRNQVGHELVKTEEFVVPVGTSIVVSGLEFTSPSCELTAEQKRILAQVFNALEEITENTVNDPDARRVAEFARMKVQVRGYSTFARDRKKDRAISEGCAQVVRTYITSLGTPAWRLEAKGLGHRKPAALKIAERPLQPLSVEFARTK